MADTMSLNNTILGWLTIPPHQATSHQMWQQIVATLPEQGTELTELQIPCFARGRDRLDDQTIQTLARYCPNLTKVSMENCHQVTDEAILALARHCSKLRSVNLHNSARVTDTSLQTLVYRCPHLTHLDVGGCVSLTDATIYALGQSCPKLVGLNVNGCYQVTEVALSALVMNCPQLNDLYLPRRRDGIHRISTDFIRLLREKLGRSQMAAWRIHRFWRDVNCNPQYRYAREVGIPRLARWDED